MAIRPWIALSLIWSLSASLASAAELVLQWEFPRAEPVESFLVTYRFSGDPGDVLQQFRVPWSDAPTCEALSEGQTPDAFCARPPECLAPGVYTFRVQAEVAGEVSEGSNWMSCEALPNCTYDCVKFEQANAALRDPTTLPPAPTPAVPTLPNTETLEALTHQLASLDRNVPKSPGTPIVATAPT